MDAHDRNDESQEYHGAMPVPEAPAPPFEEPAVDEIEPARSGVTAIIGHSRIGPVGVARAVGSESEANQIFGDFEEAPVLAPSIHGFYQNGGRRCVIINLGETHRPLMANDLDGLAAHGDIELVCAPGKTEAQDYQVLLDHCSASMTRLAVLDGPRDLSRHLVSFRPPSSGHGAIYVPWLKVHDPIQRTLAAVPPSAHMAGLMARVAELRGVNKAPANEPLAGLVELDLDIDQGLQNILHPRRINCIRRLPRLEGFRPWGAQTLAAQPPFDNIGSFRVASHVIRSFRTGCPWLMGMLNEPETWQRLTRAGRRFLTGLWQAGVLVAPTEQQAFRLRCDESNNELGQPDRQQIHLDIGLALSPGHLFNFRLALDTSGF